MHYHCIIMKSNIFLSCITHVIIIKSNENYHALKCYIHVYCIAMYIKCKSGQILEGILFMKHLFFLKLHVFSKCLGILLSDRKTEEKSIRPKLN